MKQLDNEEIQTASAESSEKLPEKENMGSSLAGRVLTGIFLLMVFGITALSLVWPDRARSDSENRELAQKPEFSLESLFAKGDEKYSTLYETYITDQFPVRDTWIGVKTNSELLLGKTDINGVYFADDGYLITKTDKSDVNQEQEEKNIARLKAFLEKYSELLGKDRVHAMLIPTAADILSDKLPAFATEYDQEALLDRLAAEFGESLIDVREELKSHADEYLYYRTDHHWTALGAYYAYRSWAEALGMTVREPEDYDITVGSEAFFGTLYSKVNLPMKPDTILLYQDGMPYRVEYDMSGTFTNGMFVMDRLEEKDKYMVYLDGNHAMVKIQGTNKNGKTLLVVKDSYAHTFVPFLAQDYETVIMIDFRYNKMPVSALTESFGVTDILLLYNATNFIEDVNLYQLER